MMKIKQEKEEVVHSLSEEEQEKFSSPAKGNYYLRGVWVKKGHPL